MLTNIAHYCFNKKFSLFDREKIFGLKKLFIYKVLKVNDLNDYFLILEYFNVINFYSGGSPFIRKVYFLSKLVKKRKKFRFLYLIIFAKITAHSRLIYFLFNSKVLINEFFFYFRFSDGLRLRNIKPLFVSYNNIVLVRYMVFNSYAFSSTYLFLRLYFRLFFKCILSAKSLTNYSRKIFYEKA